MDKFLSKTKVSGKENVEISSSDSSFEASNVSAPKGTKKKGSAVWTYFLKARDGKYAKCRICSNVYKTSGNTSNLIDHLKRAHPACRQNPIPDNTIDTYFKKSSQYDSTSERKKAIDTALISMICSDIQPFSIVEDKGFQDFVKCLDPRYVLPSRNTLKNIHMAEMYRVAKEKLKFILNDMEYCAITTDGWTSRANEGYLTVTCHFVQNFVLRSAVLSTKKLLVATNHTADNIAASLREVFEEWGILHKVITIVTDNDSTMIKACELLQKRHLPCYAHTLNLAVHDCLEQPNIKAILSKCKGIVTFFKSSTISYEKFKMAQGREKPLSLIQQVPTRWNSALRMIERILDTNEHISSVLLATSKAPTPLTADEVNFLKDLKEVLSPFDHATVQTSANTTVTISLIIPLTFGLFQSLEELKCKLCTSDGLEACLFLIERIKKRLFPYEERTASRLGTLLDPRFKKEGFRSIYNADQAAKSLENEIAGMGKSNKTSLATSTTCETDTKQPLLKFLEHKKANKTRTTRVDAIVTIRQYIENENTPTESDPLQYWSVNGNEMSALQNCAIRYLCIPATSTESERMFSKAGSIISDRRTCLKSKNVDMLLFLNKNYWVTQ
ncbi:E3 SUMO-protein ligase ZBED1-like [Musca autumnalis]|uniref:E3 SUMO-protein ligase ZBED1-like n=1 Tax=Musca autumnalis TaxID=221902 RepID=UPI003CE6B456